MVSNDISSVVTIYHHKKEATYFSIFLSNKKNPKSKKEIEKWTFINVQKRKPEKSFENASLFQGQSIMVTIVFLGVNLCDDTFFVFLQEFKYFGILRREWK